MSVARSPLFAIVVAACGSHAASPDATPDAPIDGSSEVCTPFSVTAPGAQGVRARPLWTGTIWAIGEPGLYVRIEETGTLTTIPLPDLGDEPLAWDGHELGYYVPMPEPHIALFSPDDAATVHAGPAFGVASTDVVADVARDPMDPTRLGAFFTETYPKASYGWSTGSVEELGFPTGAMAMSSDGVLALYWKAWADPATGDTFELQINVRAATARARRSVASGLTAVPSGPYDIEGDASASVIRFGMGASVPGQTEMSPPIPPVAWNGTVFITANNRDVVTHDATSFQPITTRPNALPAGTLLGVGATKRRALFMLSTDGADVQYVQICF